MALFKQDTPLHIASIKNSRSVFVFDVSNLGHRYWHAMKFMTSGGRRTGHVFGFFKAVLSLIKACPGKPSSLVYALDGYPERRYDIYPDYKGNRSGKADPVPDVAKVAKAMPGYVVHTPEWEADDAIASFISRLRRIEERKDEPLRDVYIISGDQDLYQLIDEKTSVWVKSKDSPITLENILSTGGQPHHIRLQKVLHGDSSDNIKGVPYLRKKDVLDAVVASDGSVKDFMHKAKKICKESTFKRLQDHKSIIRRNDMLVTLQIHKVLPRKNKTDEGRLRSILIDEFGCQSLEKDIGRLFHARS